MIFDWLFWYRKMSVIDIFIVTRRLRHLRSLAFSLVLFSYWRHFLCLLVVDATPPYLPLSPPFLLHHAAACSLHIRPGSKAPLTCRIRHVIISFISMPHPYTFISRHIAFIFWCHFRGYTLSGRHSSSRRSCRHYDRHIAYLFTDTAMAAQTRTAAFSSPELSFSSYLLLFLAPLYFLYSWMEALPSFPFSIIISFQSLLLLLSFSP